VAYDTADRCICCNIPVQLGASILREAAHSSEMSVTDYQFDISEDFNFEYTL